MTVYDFVIRLLVVIVTGFAIGFERQMTGHNVGFKTTILIAIGSYVFIAPEVFIGSDATRMAANVITGIGFLCSGVIFKNGLTVNGLTTAATLWSTAAVAVLIGYGYIIEGTVGTVFILVVNILTSLAGKKMNKESEFEDSADKSYYIKVECLRTDMKKIKKLVLEESTRKLAVDNFEVETISDTKCRMVFQVSGKDSILKAVSDICDKLMEKDVISVSYVTE